MRLWHQDLIPYLPHAQLGGQHRECCALRGLGWGKPHSTIDYVFGHNPILLVAYHMLILKEKHQRGHQNTELKWRDPFYRGKNCLPWDIKDINLDIKIGDPIYPEHNSQYLISCMNNLEEKGSYLLI